MKAVLRIFKYLKGTKELGIQYNKGASLQMTCYVDASYADDSDNRRSTTGIIIFLGGGPIFWASKQQPIVATSTMEAEYIALHAALQAILHLRTILEELGIKQGPTTIFEDNMSAIHLANGPSLPRRAKHIDVRYHSVREHVEKGTIKIVPVESAKQLADINTKNLSVVTHQQLISQIMSTLRSLD
jgi:hypothetical protein